MEITPSSIPMDDITPEPDHSALAQGFHSVRIMKSWGESDSKEYIVGPPQYHNGRMIRMITCLTTSRQMALVEQDNSGEMSTVDGDSILIFVTDDGERIVLHSQTQEADPKADDAAQKAGNNDQTDGRSNGFNANGFDTGAKALYGRV